MFIMFIKNLIHHFNFTHKLTANANISFCFFDKLSLKILKLEFFIIFFTFFVLIVFLQLEFFESFFLFKTLLF